jgi:hypothetical protein
MIKLCNDWILANFVITNFFSFDWLVYMSIDVTRRKDETNRDPRDTHPVIDLFRYRVKPLFTGCPSSWYCTSSKVLCIRSCLAGRSYTTR